MSAVSLIHTDALLLKKVVYGESDAMLVLLTPGLGKITVGARGAQRSAKRFGGALEPMHTLGVELAVIRGDRYQLRSARVELPRVRLVSELSRLEAAGRGLGWIRKGSVEREPEPRVWQLATRLLDDLDAENSSEQRVDAPLALASAGLALLSAWGWALELGTCIRCGKPCPQSRPAWIDAARGGLICSSCGGASTRIDAAERDRLGAAGRGEAGALLPGDDTLALRLIETALATYADIR